MSPSKLSIGKVSTKQATLGIHTKNNAGETPSVKKESTQNPFKEQSTSDTGLNHK